MQKITEWKFFKPVFKFKKDLPDFTWSGHMPFVYDLIRNFKPSVIVELGTYKGTSALAMCQAVEDENLNTEIRCVDSWEGESQTGFYKNEVFDIYNNLTDKYAKNINLKTLRMLFDDALAQTEDKSIDILHIDGLHTYEAVKHDYETWNSKVKDDGIILFHDTRVEHFGVKDLWEEIKKANPNYIFINFRQNYGLGVVIKDTGLKNILTKEFIQKLEDYYFEETTEYQLKQRIAELENDKKDLTAGHKNLDRMLHEVLDENTGLYKKIEKLESELSRKSVRLAIRVLKKLGR